LGSTSVRTRPADLCQHGEVLDGSVIRRLPVLAGAAAAALIQGCGSSARSASGASTDATAGPNDGSSSGTGAESGSTDSSSGNPRDGSSELPPPVDAGACPNLPLLLDGGWLNISPPGSNYATTYSGINAVAVRPDNPAIIYAASTPARTPPR
jgi:hypothetical protein